VTALGSLGRRLAGDVVHAGWGAAARLGEIRAGDRRARRYGAFGAGTVVAFPRGAVYNERYIHIGTGTLIAPDVTLSVGMAPGQVMVSDPVVRIGDRCLIGRGSAVVGHLSIDVGDDVFFGTNVYVTDQNHGYELPDVPVGRQPPSPERPVRIGDGSWLGTGVVVLPGACLGAHVVVAANSVVRGEVPAHTLVAGVPARPVRRWSPGQGWSPVAVDVAHAGG
jgi:acetyltransferase-like isoleucine patch superfamily enzyme